MAPVPPAELLKTLDGLGLAGARDLARAGRRLRRLAGKSAPFDSVWLDALAQIRALSLFQAAAIDRGEAQRLRRGRFVIVEPIWRLGRLSSYRARHDETGVEFRLLAAELAAEQLPPAAERLDRLVQAGGAADAPGVALLTHAGADQGEVWAAHPQVQGRPADEWIARTGRMAPAAVLAIARQVVAALEKLEAAGLVHGDLSPRELVVDAAGSALLAAPGFRRAVFDDAALIAAALPPEAYDSLSPERVDQSPGAAAAGDRFALATLCWHLLAGRSPWPAGDAPTRLRAIERARLPDIREIAPDTPDPLAEAIARCACRDPRQRPASYAEVAELLATEAVPSRRIARRPLRTRLPSRSLRPASSWQELAAAARPSRRTVYGLASAAICIALLGLGISMWRSADKTVAAREQASTVRQSGPATTAPPRVEAAASNNNVGAPVAATPAQQPDTPQVAPVGYESAGGWQQRAALAGGPPQLLLPTDRPLRVASLRLLPGQEVRGAGGLRPRISAPPEGIVVDVEGVRFVDVDFVADADSQEHKPADHGRAARRMLQLRALKASFERCTFDGLAIDADAVTAIDWNTAALADPSSLALINAQLELKDCVLAGVTAGVVCRWNGALGVAIDNTLHLGPGSLVRLTRAPQVDEPIGLLLTHVTARGGSSLVELAYRAPPLHPGRISVSARECVFALQAAGSLISFVGPEAPGTLAESIEWEGQGSVLAPQSGLAAWRGPGGRTSPIDTDRLRVTGLVRSEVGFAGAASAGASSSRAIRWQVPLRSPHPPGIDETRLPATAAIR